MEQDPDNSAKSIKIKVGIFFGYNGQKFLGLQYQRDTQNTIQNIIHKVLCENGFVLKSNADSLRRIKWSRAGRTDKKVHALCNGISVNLQFGNRYIINRQNKEVNYERAVKDINEHLPFDIRIFTMKKLSKKFQMRHDTYSRIYNYIAPVKLFLPKQDFINGKIPNEPETKQIVQKLNHLVQLYLGTHNFHNFTKGYKTNDPRCDRFIISMKAQIVEEEVIQRFLGQKFQKEEDRKKEDLNFVRFTLVGQSFIYHQIRKMIGLLIKIFHQELPAEETIKQSFKLDRFQVYLAPGEGLYLNRMTFEGYNRKKDNTLPIDFTEQEEVRIVKYRAYLQSKILDHEVNEKVFTNWLANKNIISKEEESQEQKSINND